jgi:hypothetical protein
MKEPLERLVARFKQSITVDFVGLCELFYAVKADFPGVEPTRIQEITLELVQRMLAAGFQVGQLSSDGRTLVPWPDQRPSEVIDQIKNEWNSLGREPNIGDIGWFDCTPLSDS